MDDDATLDVLRDEAAALADAAVGDLDAAVATYSDWTVADLVVHTGRIHRWVTGIVRNRATGRPPQPEIADRPDDLVGWFRAGADALVDVLATVDPSTAVWSFAGQPTVGFWRRRMALETTIHRWDAQDATGQPGPIAAEIAVAGVTEALEVYLEPRLRGADVDGGGEVVALRASGAATTWTLRLERDGLRLLDSGHAPDVRIDAAPTDLWLFLMNRAHTDVLTIEGPARSVDVLRRAITLVPAPSR